MRAYLKLGVQKGWNRLMVKSLFFSVFLALSSFASAQQASTQLAEEQDFVFASSLFKDGVYQLAAEQFAKFLKKYPTSLKRTDAAFLKCECSFQSGQYAEATAGFSRFVKEYPSSSLTADGFFRIGESNLKLKRPSEAIAAFKVVTDRFGERDLAGEAAYWIGEAYIKSDDENNALKYYSLAYENYPKNKLRDYALYSMAWTHQHKSDFAKGIESYRRLITEFPESKLAASAKVRIGECLYYLKDYKNAIAELSKTRASIVEPPEQGDADYLIAEAHYQIGEYPVAQSKYQAFLSSHPDHKLVREVLYALGWTLLKQKEYQKAVTTFNKLVDGADALAHSALFRRGTAEKLAGNTGSALVTFANVFQRSPQGDFSDNALYESGLISFEGKKTQDEFSDNALYESGLIAFEGKKTQEAKNYFLRVVGEYSASDVFAESEWMLGECFLVESSFKDAHGWFSKAAAHPNASFEVKVNARYQAAWCLYKMKDYTASVSALKSFVGDFPKHPNAAKARFWLAESEYQRGNYKEAQEAYRPLAEELGEKQEEAMYGMGWSQFKMGQFDKAIDSFEKLVASFPKGKMVFDARLRLADAYFSQKDYKKAVSSYRTVIRTYPTNESVDYAHYQLLLKPC
ncbi:MAG: Outer membrane assembly lipoprotein YfiO [Bacteroidetes bacterium]|nr:Outer membrane assembly lipoprotein YfiO [Bacteroidota bacterium]